MRELPPGDFRSTGRQDASLCAADGNAKLRLGLGLGLAAVGVVVVAVYWAGCA